MPNSPFRMLLRPIVLLFFVIGLAPLAHAAALMSPLDVDECFDSARILCAGHCFER